MKNILANKKNLANDFKERHNIDFEVLFDPNHPKFEERYALEDPLNENMIMAIKLQSATRQTYVFLGFAGYHLFKTVAWRFGYFARFFYRTRFMTFPILGLAIYFNLKKTMTDLKEANLLGYNIKRVKFDRDSKLVEKILRSKVDLAKEK